MSKKNKIIFAIAVAAAWVVVLVLAAIFLLPMLKNLNQEDPHTPEEVVEIALEAMINDGTEELVLLGADGTPVGIADATGLADMITSKIKYSLLSMEIMEDKAVATLEIEAPDALAVVQQALKDMETYDEAAFLERMATLLEGNLETIKHTVEVEMVRVEDHWCMITNPQFSDAITGGLISRYLELQEAIMDALKKEALE